MNADIKQIIVLYSFRLQTSRLQFFTVDVISKLIRKTSLSSTISLEQRKKTINLHFQLFLSWPVIATWAYILRIHHSTLFSTQYYGQRMANVSITKQGNGDFFISPIGNKMNGQAPLARSCSSSTSNREAHAQFFAKQSRTRTQALTR